MTRNVTTATTAALPTGADAAAVPVAAAKPRRVAAHTKERDPKDREQWKRDRAIALGHAAKPTK